MSVVLLSKEVVSVMCGLKQELFLMTVLLKRRAVSDMGGLIQREGGRVLLMRVVILSWVGPGKSLNPERWEFALKMHLRVILIVF